MLSKLTSTRYNQKEGGGQIHCERHSVCMRNDKSITRIVEKWTMGAIMRFFFNFAVSLNRCDKQWILLQDLKAGSWKGYTQAFRAIWPLPSSTFPFLHFLHLAALPDILTKFHRLVTTFNQTTKQENLRKTKKASSKRMNKWIQLTHGPLWSAKVKTSHRIFTVQHKFWHEEIKLTLVKDTLTAYYIEPNSGMQKLYSIMSCLLPQDTCF